MSHRGLHQKNRMRTTEIYYILHEAIQAHREVAIQIEAIDCNGSYQEDIIGFIKNSDLLGIYIKNQKVHRIGSVIGF